MQRKDCMKNVSSGERSTARAREMYGVLTGLLDEAGIAYSANEQSLSVSSTAVGNDLPMPFTFLIDPSRELLAIVSDLPFSVPESRTFHTALGVCAANSVTFEGRFDFDYRAGRMRFVITSSYAAGDIDKKIFDHMLSVALNTIDMYNDRFAVAALNDIAADDIYDYIIKGDAAV